MKKLFFTLAATLLISISAMAQDENHPDRPRFSPEEMVQHQTEMMTNELGLNEEQSAKVLDLNKRYEAKRSESFENMRKGGERPSEEQMQEMRKQMETERTAYNEELKQILTEEQYTKYEEMMKNMRQNRHGKGGPRGPRPDGAQ